MPSPNLFIAYFDFVVAVMITIGMAIFIASKLNLFS